MSSAHRPWWHPLGVDDRLVSPAPAGPLVLMRVLLVAVIGLRLVLRRWWVMAERPGELFDPVPFLSWLNDQPGTAAIVVVWLVGLAAVAATLWSAATGGRGGRASFVLAWASLLVLAGLWGSAGKVMHNDVLLLTVAAPLLFAAAPTRSDLRRDPEVRWGWPPRAALALLALVYFLTGYQKVRHSGFDWAFGPNMSWVIRQGSSPFGEAFSRWFADRSIVTQAMSAGALLLELAAPLLLAVRRVRPLFAVAASVMHLSIWAFLGLDYYGWVLTVWAVVIPTSALGDRLLGHRRDEPSVSPAQADV